MGILIVVFVNVAFLILIYMTLSRKVARIEKRGIPEELQAEMDTILTTFNRTADRNIDLLDDRLRKIEPVAERAERLQQQLDGLIRRAEALQKFRELTQPGTATDAVSARPVVSAAPTALTAATAYRQANGAPTAETVEPAASPADRSATRAERKARRKKRSPDEILREMTEDGSPPEEIARILGIPREEVMLKQRLLRLS